MTKIEIINYVKTWFETHPRSVVENDNADPNEKTSCVYNGPNGEKCAFALFVKDSYILEENQQATECLERYGVDILKDEVKNHEGIFWNDIQWFHDHDNNWIKTDTGNILTENGVNIYKYLLENYKES